MRNSPLWKMTRCRSRGRRHVDQLCQRLFVRSKFNLWPDVWCNWKKCVPEKGALPNSGDRRDSDHSLRLPATFSIITQRDHGIDMHRPPRRCHDAASTTFVSSAAAAKYVRLSVRETP